MNVQGQAVIGLWVLFVCFGNPFSVQGALGATQVLGRPGGVGGVRCGMKLV